VIVVFGIAQATRRFEMVSFKIVLLGMMLLSVALALGKFLFYLKLFINCQIKGVISLHHD
jgi:hypothetical protein